MKRPRFFSSRRVRRGLVVLSVLTVLGTCAALVAFRSIAAETDLYFHPVTEPIALTAEHRSLIAETPHYARPEESTYLTFPEWYLVFNPQEYAAFLRDHPPSGFAYFGSIGQFWRGYAHVYGATRNHYPLNLGNHVMVVVIGASTTVEYAIKGLYENTVGRLTEWSAGGEKTAEDGFAAQVARDYGEFVPTRPWFEFPFGARFNALWTDTEFFGRHFLRKLERKLFLSAEYGVKFLYAAVIRMASHAAYGVADTEVYATVRHAPAAAFALPGVKRVRELSDGTTVITLPHYQGFTDTAPRFAQTGADFVEIAGNNEMLVTCVAPRTWRGDLPAGRVLFTLPMLTDPGLQRLALQVPVRDLAALLRELPKRDLRLEHLFDY